MQAWGRIGGWYSLSLIRSIESEDLSLPHLQEIEVILQQKLQEISTPQLQKTSPAKQGKGGRPTLDPLIVIGIPALTFLLSTLA
jgi:hypothetical protein